MPGKQEIDGQTAERMLALYINGDRAIPLGQLPQFSLMITEEHFAGYRVGGISESRLRFDPRRVDVGEVVTARYKPHLNCVMWMKEEDPNPWPLPAGVHRLLRVSLDAPGTFEPWDEEYAQLMWLKHWEGNDDGRPFGALPWLRATMRRDIRSNQKLFVDIVPRFVGVGRDQFGLLVDSGVFELGERPMVVPLEDAHQLYRFMNIYRVNEETGEIVGEPRLSARVRGKRWRVVVDSWRGVARQLFGDWLDGQVPYEYLEVVEFVYTRGNRLRLGRRDKQDVHALLPKGHGLVRGDMVQMVPQMEKGEGWFRMVGRGRDLGECCLCEQEKTDMTLPFGEEGASRTYYDVNGALGRLVDDDSEW